MRLLILFLGSIIFLTSCEKQIKKISKGEIQFSVNGEFLLKEGEKELDKFNTLIISIESSEGEIVLENASVPLHIFNENLLSEPIPLNIGTYFITSCLITDDNDSVLYAAPLKGSKYDYLVKKPLKIEFEVEKNDVSKVNIEVIPVSYGSSADFGYATFSVDILGTKYLCIATLAFNSDIDNFELIDATLSVSSNDSLFLEDTLEANINTIILPIKDSYTISISKAGYPDVDTVISSLDLFNCKTTGEPLTIILQVSDSKNTLVLQPGSEEGMDAVIWNLDPNVNRGAYNDISAIAWTNGGAFTNMRSLIKFDLTSIPIDEEIDQAKLFLYGYLSKANGTSESLSGANYTLLCPITSGWDEMSVTWNTQPTFDKNRAILLDSCNTITDYEIDVTEHIQDIVNGTYENNGWMLILETEETYRRMIFASSDYELEEKRPKLVISY